MPPFLQTYRSVVWTTLLLLGAFFTTSIAGYQSATHALQQEIGERVLPLAGDQVQAALQSDLEKPAVIASMMANDSFVQDWLLNGEGDAAPIVHYLSEVRQLQGAATTFLVSERSRKYYYADGTLKAIQEDDAQDNWFFRAKEAHVPFVVDISVDHANGGALTVFIHHRMLARDGAFLGVAGVGLKADRLGELIENVQRRFDSRIYFVDGQGSLVLAGSALKQWRGALRQAPGIGGLAHALLHKDSKPAWFEYQRDGARVLVSSRFVPELGWHLLVEQDFAPLVEPLRHRFLLNLAIGLGATLVALIILLLAARRHRAQLERTAGSDPLTGLLNRQAFDIVFHHAKLDAERTGRPMSCILFDIDFLKQINDSHGYGAGDDVLRMAAMVARNTVRESDVIVRWGGEEFMVLLKECALEQAATVAEKLREAIDAHDFSAMVPHRGITISLGVAQFGMQEAGWAFFARLYEALSKAKANGRNRLQVALAAHSACAEAARA
ncbi:MAG TPA: sensor domain-containing diguanylate cyclase [Noviherbaspirillum sp.]|uniref:sensor domain-containing diguanylate cyclase n=1 Tax=Noviherbaspirillum sp. TaxID=1926288 RepID=UPI002B49AE2D|nr:sensor domain-containing diguanylate cyclase [Noviherbaspirillum sp.]HJV86129.1 sensor domain-containing diguanylate cyclase [Noviherbaspirillum sp.]